MADEGSRFGHGPWFCCFSGLFNIVDDTFDKLPIGLYLHQKYPAAYDVRLPCHYDCVLFLLFPFCGFVFVGDVMIALPFTYLKYCHVAIILLLLLYPSPSLHSSLPPHPLIFS